MRKAHKLRCFSKSERSCLREEEEKDHYVLSKSKSSKIYNQYDGVVGRASALQSVDLGFISQVQSYQKTLWYLHLLCLALEPSSLLVVSLGKILSGMPSFFLWHTGGGPISLQVVVAQLIKD